MKSLSRFGITLFGVTFFAFLISGCTLTYRAGIYPIPPDLKIKDFQGEGQTISIKSEPIEGIVPIGHATYTYYADLKQVTDVADSFLEGELSKRGFVIQRNTVNNMTLNVTGLNITYTIGSYHCTVKMEYATSDGYKRVHIPYNSSGFYNRACDGAITKGIAYLLNDEKLIGFLVRSKPTTIPQVTAPEKPIKSTPVTLPVGATKILTWDLSDVKSAPGNNFSSTATVRKGDRLTIMEQSGEWVRVRLENGQEGWIRSEGLE